MKTRVSFILCALCLLTSNLIAQVTIAPTNLFIDSGSKFGTYMVINGSNDTQEISIDFFFGYSSTDDDGKRSIVTDDSVAKARYSIADKIKAFPQNFTLSPGQRQVVRLRINAQNDIPDGTYWARIRTTSTPETPPLELQSNDAVTARVGIKIEQVTGLFYKKGTVTTGIDISGIRTKVNENGQLVILTDVKRTGNTPFLGSITTSLLDESGAVVKQGLVSTSIYFDSTHKEELTISDLPEGNYTIKVQFESQRGDLSSKDLAQMETVTKTIPYSIR